VLSARPRGSVVKFAGFAKFVTKTINDTLA